MSGGDALILMCKAPLPGKVKTRLCPPLSPRRAAAFYAALLEDTAEEISSLRGISMYLFFAPPESKTCFLTSPFSVFSLREQSGKGLGKRMANAMSEVFDNGARRAVMIGADCPALSAGRIRSAFRELSRGSDAVFGPAEDGGVYLVGLSSPAPSQFDGIEWSSPTVLDSILSRCRKAGLTYALLPAESDVDTPEDLAALRRWLRGSSRPSCPRTRAWLARRPPAPPPAITSSRNPRE